MVQQAQQLMRAVMELGLELPDTDIKKYAAVYALVMSYLDERRYSEYQQRILQVSVM